MLSSLGTITDKTLPVLDLLAIGKWYQKLTEIDNRGAFDEVGKLVHCLRQWYWACGCHIE